MSHHKTFAGELLHGEFKDAWNDFKNFLGASKSVEDALHEGWNELSPELQNALVHGAGVINEIAADLAKVPAEIVSIIKTKFPDIDLNALKDALQVIEFEATKIETIPAATLEETIANLQTYLKGLGTGSVLPRILSQMAQTIATILSPTSVFGKIVTWLEMAYRVFVKK